MRSIKAIIVFAFLVILLASCNNTAEGINSISLNKTSLTIEEGDSYQLVVLFEPDGLEATVTWESSRESVASVSNTGKVKAAHEGTATITAFCGRLYAECKVVVTKRGLAEITVSPSSVSAPCEGGEYKVTVTSNTEWKATTDAKWVSISPSSGAGETAVNLIVAANENFTEKSTNISFMSGTSHATLNVTLAARTPEALSVTPATLDVPAEGGIYKVKVLSTINWWAEAKQKWAKLSPLSGEGDQEVTVTVDPADTTTSSEQKVRFSNGQKEVYLYIKRAAREPKPIGLSITEINAPPIGGKYSLTVTSELVYNMIPSQPWVTLESVSGNTTNIVIAENPDGTHTSAQVLVETAENKAYVNIIQQAPTLSVSPAIVSSTEDGGDFTVNITHNYKWSASCPADWVIASGSEQGSIMYIKVKKATSSTASSAIVTVKCGNKTQTVQVVRAGYDPKAFTINSKGNKVYFAHANLYYRASDNKFSFALYPYDSQGSSNTQISSTYSGYIDLFGRGTSGYYKALPCNYINTLDGYCSVSNQKNMKGTNYDWGYYNNIYYYNSSKYDPKGTWTILSSAEMEYILWSRASDSYRYLLCKVRGQNGLMLLPDHFECPSGVSITHSVNSYTTNQYTESQWNQLEVAGAVFLPAAGKRTEKTVSDNGNAGYYWLDGGTGTYDGYILKFDTSTGVHSNVQMDMCTGCAVRLVQSADGPKG